MQQYDEEYASEVKLWKSQLKPRKQALEDKFAQELQAEEQFYQMSANGNGSGSTANVMSASGGYPAPVATVITPHSQIRQPLTPM